MNNDQTSIPISFTDHRYAGTIQQIEYFTNVNLGNVRVIITSNGIPYLCLSDICDAIGIDRRNGSNIKQQLDYEYDLINRGKIYKEPYYYYTFRVEMPNASRGEKYRDILFVTENAFYSILIRSNSDRAILFRHWVCSEVLPKLRQISGGSQENVNYMLDQIAKTQRETLNQVNLYTDALDCSNADNKDLRESIFNRLIALEENLNQFKEEFRICRHVDTDGYEY